MLKIAMIIAFRNFRDEEYFVPREIFEKAGVKVTTVSTAVGTAVGVQGGETEATQTIGDFDVSKYDAVVFAGGPGSHSLADNPDMRRIVQGAVKLDKVAAAICFAPAILAKAGVLFGKKATVWSSPMDKTAVKILQEEGALYQESPVVVDGKIVTANSPAVARDFAGKVLEMFKTT